MDPGSSLPTMASAPVHESAAGGQTRQTLHDTLPATSASKPTFAFATALWQAVRRWAGWLAGDCWGGQHTTHATHPATQTPAGSAFWGFTPTQARRARLMASLRSHTHGRASPAEVIMPVRLVAIVGPNGDRQEVFQELPENVPPTLTNIRLGSYKPNMRPASPLFHGATHVEEEISHFVNLHVCQHLTPHWDRELLDCKLAGCHFSEAWAGSYDRILLPEWQLSLLEPIYFVANDLTNMCLRCAERIAREQEEDRRDAARARGA
ncbi:hypothetical protein AURDEDRAFT_172865 [Auricularia subglabra TFB-10046 SS5]|uniref:Uncharacterized protein n=1 Tax=Auricularia subglabra (strain TFB-10046 / SS5) TaxID=717982 RepID=J0WVG5_AURST|nr:hypothetical protein AURDEDRAFT_172865 [Auricularia subglabra TFB-10046 SS5]